MNRKFKLLAVALTGLVGVGSAQAADYNLGDLNTLTGFTAASANPVSSSFLDKLFFSISSDSDVGGTVKDVPMVIGNFTVLDIVGMTATLNNADTNAFISLLSYSNQGNVGSATIEQFTFDTTLNAGNYYIALTGAGVGNHGAGLYSYAVSAAPVPEPETWAMLLAGLGLVGMNLRRRGSVDTRVIA